VKEFLPWCKKTKITYFFEIAIAGKFEQQLTSLALFQSSTK
jgi:hypothetical protein